MNDNAKKVWSILISNGVTEAGAAGVLGNMQAESSIQPCRMQGDFSSGYYYSKQYCAKVDSGAISRSSFINEKSGGGGFGICQWTYWSRKAGLYDFCKSKGTSIADLKMQVEFFIKEMKERYTSVWSVLTSTNSVRAASDAVLLKYERPADQSEDVQKKRANYGQAWFNKLSGISIDVNVDTEDEVAVSIVRSMIKTGSKGSDVTYLQSSLNSLGYNCGVVDGIFGVKTSVQVRRFQIDKRLEVDGVVGPSTWAALEAALNPVEKEEVKVEEDKPVVTTPTVTQDNTKITLSTVNQGNKGALVKSMQRLLIGNGYSCGGAGADGDFGSGTLAALKRFQSAKGITSDGICGKNTWNKLLKG